MSSPNKSSDASPDKTNFLIGFLKLTEVQMKKQVEILTEEQKSIIRKLITPEKKDHESTDLNRKMTFKRKLSFSPISGNPSVKIADSIEVETQQKPVVYSKYFQNTSSQEININPDNKTDEIEFEDERKTVNDSNVGDMENQHAE